MTPPILRARNISKSFPGVLALDSVSLDIAAGEVHALAGENGAGKSTLMNILAGLDTADSGEIVFRGRGVAMIHQELMPFPDLSIAENIFMGREPAGRIPGTVNRRAMHDSARDLLRRAGVSLEPGRRMRELSVAEMQAVEIAKAAARDADVVIMDEPTSALSDREAEALFELIGDMKRRGVAVIYISHKLDEIFRLADTVTVLRDGRVVAAASVTEVDEPKLIAWMAGRELSATGREDAVRPGDVALEVRGLTRTGKFRNVSFAVRSGEILGIGGLMGAGRTEVVSAIFGLDPADGGEIRVRGQAVRIRSPRDAIAHGIGMAPEDRKGYGLVPLMTVRENLTLASPGRHCRGPLIDRRSEDRTANEQIRAFSIRPADPERAAGHLSGGNQQKVVIAKALLANPAILILDEPTRGIDVAAKAEVHAIVRGLARDGKAIILVTSEMPELISLSDRILVMREGVVAGETDPRRTSAEDVLRLAMPE